MHIGLLAGIIFLPMNQSCFGQDYGGALAFLTFSHSLNGLRFIIQTINIVLVPLLPSHNFNLYFIEKVVDFFGVTIQLLAILYAQDVYFFTNFHFKDEACSFEDFGATFSWLQLEIFLFYMNLVANFFFIFLSEALLAKTGLIYPEKSGTKSDFLMKYKTMLGLYQTFTMMLYCTIFAISRAANQSSFGLIPAGPDLFIVFALLSVSLLVHILQFIALHLQLFCSRKSRGRNE